MRMNNDLPQILSKLDQNSRKTRLISLTFTALTIAAAVAVLLLLFFQVKQKRDELTKLEQLIEEKKKEQIAISQNPDLPCEEKVKQLQQSTDSLNLVSMRTDGNITPSPAKTPTPTASKSVEPVIDKQTDKAKIIYFQVVDRSQVPKSRNIANALISSGLPVANATETREEQKGKLQSTIVRYFNKQDETIANNLASRLRSMNVENVTIEFSKVKAQIGQLEVWFSGKF